MLVIVPGDGRVIRLIGGVVARPGSRTLLRSEFKARRGYGCRVRRTTISDQVFEPIGKSFRFGKLCGGAA
jgi:hypothetical protein